METVMDVKVHLSEFHLWFEEYLLGDTNVELGIVFNHLKSAKRLTGTIIAGGVSERGEHLPPNDDPVLKEKQALLSSVVTEFDDVAKQRVANLNEFGTGTELDERLDNIFKELLVAAEAIALILEESEEKNEVLFKRFFWGTLLIWALALSTAVIGLLFMEKRRRLLFVAREEALAEVKVLQGLIPICASCKEIRDDKGAWNQLEAYIGKHSEAKFTHGLCPKCADKILREIREQE
jgi:hypothetical protein